MAPTKVKESGLEIHDVKKRQMADGSVFLSPPTAEEANQSICPSVRASIILSNLVSSVLPNQLLGVERAIELTSADDFLHLQACRIIESYGEYIDDVSVRYFQGVHRWMPVISRHRFHDRLVNHQTPIKADFSILLLTMCLITCRPEQDSKVNGVNQETLYLITKMLFGQAQAVSPATTNLIQAALLIATYEYAHGLGHAAYISIGECARMAFVAGLQKSELPHHTNEQSWLKAMEERNLWWGIVICER